MSDLKLVAEGTRLVLGAEISEPVDTETAVNALAALSQAMSEFDIACGGNGQILEVPEEKARTLSAELPRTIKPAMLAALKRGR